jgi:hypothetical protein
MALQIYRIVVHGQFADLDEGARGVLGAEAARQAALRPPRMEA